MGRVLTQIFLQKKKKNTDSQQAHEKMLNIANYQRNANQNYNNVPRLPTPVFWPGEFQGQYSPWGRKESDTTEQPSLSLFTLVTMGIIKKPTNNKCWR